MLQDGQIGVRQRYRFIHKELDRKKDLQTLGSSIAIVADFICEAMGAINSEGKGRGRIPRSGSAPPLAT
jgi:hypothetical protein